MPSASGMSAEAEIFRVCHLLRRTDRYYLAGVSLVSACLMTTGGLSRARCGDSVEAHSFSKTE
jgi:hypothetical protein